MNDHPIHYDGSWKPNSDDHTPDQRTTVLRQSLDVAIMYAPLLERMISAALEKLRSCISKVHDLVYFDSTSPQFLERYMNKFVVQEDQPHGNICLEMTDLWIKYLVFLKTLLLMQPTHEKIRENINEVVAILLLLLGSSNTEVSREAGDALHVVLPSASDSWNPNLDEVNVQHKLGAKWVEITVFL